MEKYLITGFSGFVARHFLDFLGKVETEVSVLGLDIIPPNFALDSYTNIKCSFQKLDLLDVEKTEEVVAAYKPDYILHLASYSSVAFSWKNPLLSFQNNTAIFLNLIEAVHKNSLSPRIISVGSSEEYGNVEKSAIPLTEQSPLNPVSPYAVARVSQEMFSRVYAHGYGLDILMTRSFNHIGPFQKDIFVISSFAKKLISIKNNGGPFTLKTGDLTIVRDFVDVRDVVRAYYLLFKQGKSGETYNICSGTGTTLSDILEKMEAKLNLSVKHEIDPGFIRPDDNRIIIGSNEKINQQIAWSPEYSLDQSIEDILKYWDENESPL